MIELKVDRKRGQHFDWMLAGLVLMLIAMGLVNLVSAAASGVEGGSDIVARQIMVLGIGAVLVGIVLFVDYRHFDRFAYGIYAFSVALLLLTLAVAEETRGARAWLFSGRIQPSEFAKLGMVLALAHHFGRNPPADVRRLRELLVPAVLVAIPVGLIVLQKDLGVAVLTLLIGLTVLPLVNVPLRAWLGIGLLGAVGLAAVWRYGLRAYQQERILGFLDPSRDPLSSGYQQMQSKIAVGSGGLLGKGWQEGTQTQLRFLPTQHTDFAFAQFKLPAPRHHGNQPAWREALAFNAESDICPARGKRRAIATRKLREIKPAHRQIAVEHRPAASRAQFHRGDRLTAIKHP